MNSASTSVSGTEAVADLPLRAIDALGLSTGLDEGTEFLASTSLMAYNRRGQGDQKGHDAGSHWYLLHATVAQDIVHVSIAVPCHQQTQYIGT